ncbi:MAG TPA: Fic family protein [Steroidobacteraceae bacterium]|nr:Fic family protein [Steroidobacteraceae bacterium]
MYDSIEDHYCYKGTKVLKNRRNLRTQQALDRFELAITTQRATEALPRGKLDELHYKRIHWHLFRDVYTWAGKYRNVRISKGDSAFCYPEYISSEVKKLFAELHRGNHLTGLTAAEFAVRAASLLANLNAIHAFRDGNGRSQMVFMNLLAIRARHPLRLTKIVPADFLAAMIHAFRGDEKPLADELARLL